nr:MAG TPA: hypothetical protein [Caudoviricetes sp.]
MKAYKGFNRDMTCRNFQYEEGKTYKEGTAKLCNSGFHACIDPLDCLRYYAPGQSVYREVELEDNGERETEDSKICGKKITIGAEIGLPGIIKAHFDYVKSNCTMGHTDPKQATAGNYGAATAGNYGAATAGNSGAATAGNSGAATAGFRGAATAGDSGAATSRGKVSVGENGVGTVRGDEVMIRGGMGAMLTIAVESKTSLDIVAWKSFVIDGKTYKPDVWYTLRNGEIVEAEK